MIHKENNFSIMKSADGIPLALVYQGKTLPLKQVTENEILHLRASENPGFVYKLKNNLFYTEIDNSFKFVSTCLGNFYHLCNNCQKLGKGCIKVSELSKERLKNDGTKPIKALVFSKRIEKYSFIEEGFEAFNISQETLFVIKCDDYIPYSNVKNKLSSNEILELKKALSDFMYS